MPTNEVINAPQSNPTRREGEVGTNLGITRSSVSDFQAAQAESVRRTMEMGRYPANLLVQDDALNDGVDYGDSYSRFFDLDAIAFKYGWDRQEALVLYFILLSTREGDIVFDPFNTIVGLPEKLGRERAGL